jgi:hypothetical protein
MLPVYGLHVNVSNFLLHLFPFISLQNSHTIRRRNSYLQKNDEFLYVIQYEWRLSRVLDKSWDFLSSINTKIIFEISIEMNCVCIKYQGSLLHNIY